MPSPATAAAAAARADRPPQLQAGLKKQGHNYSGDELASLLAALEDEDRVLVTGETVYRV
jgi:hypothetical protein